MQIGTAEEHSQVASLARLARAMDSAIAVPGTSLRFGWDPVIGLIPGFGDAASAVISGYIIFRSAKLGASPLLLCRMLLNVLIDSLVGTIPLAGDLFDVGWKANIRNVTLLEAAITNRKLTPRSSKQTGRLFSLIIFTLTFLIVAGCMILGIAVIATLFRAIG